MAVKRGLAAESVDENPEFQETHQKNHRLKFTKCLFKDEWLTKYSAHLESSLRKVVREEAEKAIVRHFQSIPGELGPDTWARKPISRSQGRFGKAHTSFFVQTFQSLYQRDLLHRLYTGNSIEPEGPLPLKVVLLDAFSGRLIKDGPLASAKVELVALHGHFKAELLEDWTEKQFSDNIVPARVGKRPLLVGERERVISLYNGIGYINGISFTDNSSWERTKMFRLGAKIEPKMGKQVREAVSSPFEVKDRRGESYQKHVVPALEDDVWRLRGIAKDGKICKRLADRQIYKVRDVLQIYSTDQSLLREVLGVKHKLWETIVQQITMCFSNDVCTNLNVLAPNFICTEPISPTTVPTLQLHHVSAPEANQDEPDTYGIGTNHELGQSMALNQDMFIGTNPITGGFFNGSSCDDGQNMPLEYMAPSSSLGAPSFVQDMFDFPTSNWVPISQPIGEDGNAFFFGSNGGSPIQILSSIANLGASTSERACCSKGGWSKLRAKWKVLVKYDDSALKKGKFPFNE